MPIMPHEPTSEELPKGEEGSFCSPEPNLDEGVPMTTRRDFFKSAGMAAAGTVGFPALVRAQARPGVPSDSETLGVPPIRGKTPSAVATNGYLPTLLPLADRVELRKINVRLTKLAIQQCSSDSGVANQILFDTLICESLLAFAAHSVSPGDLLKLSRDFDVVFLWSLVYGDVRTTFNARFIRFPLAIAFPRTVDEVVFWINFVRAHQFSVSIRSGNNCYESFSIDNEIVIDLTFSHFTTTPSKGRTVSARPESRCRPRRPRRASGRALHGARQVRSHSCRGSVFAGVSWRSGWYRGSRFFDTRVWLRV